MIGNFLKVTSILVLTFGLIAGCALAIIKFIDYLEENPYGSKALIQKIVYTSIVAHLIFLLKGMSIFQIIFSLSIQYAYHCLFDIYPIVRPDDPRFIYGLVASLVNYFLMIRFVSVTDGSLISIIPYFIIIWTTPIVFFFSMSATEDSLFVKKTGKRNQTYAGLALEWAFNMGKRLRESKFQN